MKLLVETTGPFQLLDPTTGAEFPHDRPALVPASHFITTRGSVGQVKILLADVPDHYTDDQWVKLRAKHDTDAAAVKAFELVIHPSAKDRDPPERDLHSAKVMPKAPHHN